jgi:hypothetical protein
MMKLTLDIVKAMHADEELVNACKTVLKAMAYTETIRPELEKLQYDILNELQIKSINDGKVINDSERLYLANDEDAQKYCTLYNDAVLALGYKIKEFGCCPLLQANELTRKAEHSLIEMAKKYTGIGVDDLIYFLKDGTFAIRKYIDLTLKLFAHKIKVA